MISSSTLKKLTKFNLISVKFICLLALISFCLILFHIKVFNKSVDSDKNEAKVTVKILNNKYPNKAIPLSNQDIIEFEQAEKLTNVNLNYWNKWIKYSKIENEWTGYKVDVCDTEIAWIDEIDFNNIFWQILPNKSNAQYFIYNAYYDNRDDTNFVRIIGTQRTSGTSDLMCLLYFEDKRQSIKSMAEKFVFHIKDSNSSYDTVLLSCPIPTNIGEIVPKAVSLITTKTCPQRVDNSMRVIYEKPIDKKQLFGVCHKAFRFETNDFSLILVEWLELLKIFGVNQVYIYSLSAHPNLKKVMDYYQNLGFLDWKELTLPGEQPNNRYLYQIYSKTLHKKFWSTEILEYYDCFYRNIHKYEYIGVFDIDEIIVPYNGLNWTMMIQKINDNTDFRSTKTATYSFKGARVFSDLEYPRINSNNKNHMTYSMSHPYRGRFREIEPHKCIHLTSKVKHFNHHSNMGCIDPNKCQTYVVDPKDAYFLHFRIGWTVKAECPNYKSCIKYDPILFKHKNTLEENMKIALANIFS